MRIGIRHTIPLPGPFYLAPSRKRRKRAAVKRPAGTVMTYGEMCALENSLRSSGYNMDWYRAQTHRTQQAILRDLRSFMALHAH